MKTIIVDVDNCLLDFCYQFSNWYNSNHPRKISSNPESYDFGLGKEALHSAIMQFWASDDMDKIPPLSLAFESFHELQKHFDVKIFTAVDWSHRLSRQKSLFGLRYTEMHFYPDNKVEKILEADPDYIIEDSPSHIEKIIKKNKKVHVYMPIWNYNSNFAFWNKKRVTSFNQVVFWKNMLEDVKTEEWI